MRAIEVMTSEHRRIVGVLDALEAFAAGLTGRPEDRAELSRFVAFLRGYADGRHHGKEENVLFLAMLRNGVEADDGPVAMMLDEHQELRELLGRMREMAAAGGPWTDPERNQARATLRGYARLLRDHIATEDEVVYRLAEERLPPNVRDAVDGECAAVDANRPDEEGEPLELLGDALVAAHPRSAGPAALADDP